MPRKVKRKSAPLVVSPPEDDSSSEATAVPNQVKRTKSSGAGAPPFAFVLGVASHPKLPPPRNELPTDQDDPLLGPRFELLLLPGGVPTTARDGLPASSPRTPRAAEPSGSAGGPNERLRQFKALCELLLPNMRAASHLAHLILRSPASYTLCLSELGELVGGATFRLVHCAKKRVLILEVLLLAVDPRPGVCGRGHATRLCNYMKRLLSWQAELKGCQALLLTQSDFGVARHFWARQKLRALPQATLLAKALYDWEPHDNQIYAYSIPMLCWLPREKSAQPAAYCAPAHSARAQMMASDRHVLEYRHTRHTQSVRIKLCGAITLLPPIEVESAGLERSRQPAGAAAAAAAASARVPVAPELMLACGKCAKRTGKLYECVVCCAVGHLGCLAPRAGKGTDAQAAAVAEVLALAVAVAEACKLPPLPELPDRPPPFTCNGCLALIASGGAEPREGTKASPRLSCDFVVRELCEQAAEWRAAQPAPPNPE